MLLVLRSFLNPLLQNRLFFVTQHLVAGFGRHQERILGVDPLNQFALLRVAGNNGILPAGQLLGCGVELVEPKVCRYRLAVMTMTGKALRNDLANITVVVDLLNGGSLSSFTWQAPYTCRKHTKAGYVEAKAECLANSDSHLDSIQRSW